MEVTKIFKPIIKDVVNCEHSARVCSIQLPTLKNGIVDIKTYPNLDYFSRYITQIKDCSNNKLADYEYEYNYSDNCIVGLSIRVNSVENRKNGSRLGELLRLVSIIEMIENKFDLIKLFSKDTAIFFHSRYGFKANVEILSSQMMFLKTITEDKSDLMKAVNLKAQSLLEKMQKSQLPVKNCKYTDDINEVINEYIHLAQDSDRPYETHGLNRGVFMCLTKEDVLKQKDFFNNLLKKHNIDYTI